MVEETKTELDSDITQSYLAILTHSRTAQQARDELAKVTCKTINARSVQWVPIQVVKLVRGELEANDLSVPESISENQQQLIQRLDGQSRPLIEPSEDEPGATEIGIEMPNSGILLTRLVAAPGSLPSFITFLKLSAGYFVLADQLQQQNQLKTSFVESAIRLELQETLFQPESQSVVLSQFCQKLKRTINADTVLLCVRSSSRKSRKLKVIGEDEKSEPQGETERLARQLADEAILGGQELDEAMDSDSSVPSRSATLLANKLGVEQVFAVTLCDSAGNARGAVVLAGNNFEAARVDALRRVMKSVAQPLLFRVSPKLSGVQKESKRFRMGWLVGFLALASMTGLMFVPVPNQIHSSLMLVPTERRFVAAPFDGLLLTSEVESGQLVQVGDSLGFMDDQSLQLEQSQLKAEAIRVQKQVDSYLTEGNIEKTQMAELRLTEINASLKLVAERIRNSHIVSPIEGFVISRDLDDVENSSVALGQTLFEVAPLETLRAEIEVPSRRAQDLVVGQSTQIWIENGDGIRRSGKITRIAPTAEVRDGRNVVICELLVPNDSDLLRPGMKGRATLDGGQRTVGWILFHRVWDRLRVYVGV